jgi:hypothetical protein
MSRDSDRVLLLYLPFGALSYPSLGLSLLKNALELEGIPCDIRYLDYDLLDMLPGDAASMSFSQSRPPAAVGGEPEAGHPRHPL